MLKDLIYFPMAFLFLIDDGHLSRNEQKNMFKVPDCFDPVSQLCPLLLLGNNEEGSRAESPADTMPSEQFDMVCLGGGVAAGEATRLIQSANLRTRRVSCSLQRQSRLQVRRLGASFGPPCHACTHAGSCCCLRNGCVLLREEAPGVCRRLSTYTEMQHSRVLQQQQQQSLCA